jgi:hypothetical protein
MKLFACFFVLLAIFIGNDAPCAPVTASQASQAVSNWLARHGGPLLAADRTAGTTATTPQADASGTTLYYIVPLTGGGFVLAAGDDAVEPILAFSATGSPSAAPEGPLAYFAANDLSQRLRAVEQTARTASDATAQTAKAKWDALLDAASSEAADRTQGKTSIAAVMVSPLLTTKWGQDNDADGTPTYNLATPTVAGGARTLTGCVATALAQLIAFHKHPTQGVGTASQAIKVCQTCSGSSPGDCASASVPLKGGDGAGGAYDFDAMPAVPGSSTTSAQRAMISALMADAGAVSRMDYATCFSGAWQWYAAAGLTSVFGYGNAVWNVGGPSGSYTMTADQYRTILNANLDAGLPVLVTMTAQSDGSGHEVAADGYGYDGFTPYHHLNMGWNGQDDVWYNLPIVSTDTAKFNLIWTLVFNVYKTGTGEIISGRITDADGAALAGVQVSAAPAAGGEGWTAVTDANGIYAFPNLASATTYELRASRWGWQFAPLSVTTGTSGSPTGDDQGNITNYQNNACGNVWGADFAGSFVGAAIAPQIAPLILND